MTLTTIPFVRTLPSLSLGVMMLAITGTAIAHHSFNGVFDGTRALRLQGLVTSVEWTNPHSHIYLEVRTAAGAIERWALEGPSVTGLQRRGVDRQIVKAGDTLGVCGYAASQDVAGTPRQLSAAVLILRGGEQRLWENYRQGKCGLDVDPIPGQR